jgi:hypothetical protein
MNVSCVNFGLDIYIHGTAREPSLHLKIKGIHISKEL